jgi:hypothetical protein
VGEITPPKTDRNWEIWRRYVTGNESKTALAREYGLTGSRVSQIIWKCEDKVTAMLERDLFPMSTNALRDEILGIEFCFEYYWPFQQQDRYRFCTNIKDEIGEPIRVWVKKEK